MNITIAHNWEGFISRLLQKGDYSSRDELIEEALQALKEKRAAESRKREELIGALQQGIDSLNAGRGIVADSDFYERIIERGEKRLKEHNA